jgi:hypothetical protein
MRQRLDELDALLQRMLTLPVNQLPEAEEGRQTETSPGPAAKDRHKFATPPAERPGSLPVPAAESKPVPPSRGEKSREPTTRSEPAASLRGPLVVFQPVSSPAAMVIEEPAAPTDEQSAELAAAAVPDYSPPPPEPVNGWGPAAKSETTSPMPSPALEAGAALPEPCSPFLERHKARIRRRRRSAPWLGPLGWINQLFDRSAVAVGGPGLWLVRHEGRKVLGLLGLAMLVAAAAVLLGDWLGWTW